uniref:cytochrome c oxidase subunit III n=1 Tax=Bargmannia lata TaxID=2078594 RepID=UPI0026E2C1A0|nr:cytochrome c oxidase subunit III [Bargmannia lata]WJJ70061.1 cytochrome c oxidase subunit 3 [Bargmannia lata]
MKYHPYHLVNPSPWPYIIGCGVLLLTSGLVIFFSYSKIFIFFIGFFIIIFTMILWFKDIIRESTYQGLHTKSVLSGLKIGFILFIISEILLFFSFFWAFFHSSLSPSIEIGLLWPPLNIEALNPFSIPLLNTAILLSSGATVTWTHHCLLKGEKKNVLKALSLTISLGILFTLFQVFEYYEASFSISDSVYGAVFFIATGFHGFHVLIGTLFLGICLIRINFSHFTISHHFGFEAASWYWHFVDVVWLFLFICIYW